MPKQQRGPVFTNSRMRGNLLETNLLVLKPIEHSDLENVKAIFKDPSAVKYFEDGHTYEEKDWYAQDGVMYKRFQEWVKLSCNKELSLWLVYSNTNDLMGAISLSRLPSGPIYVSVLLFTEYQQEKNAIEAICYLAWYYQHFDPLGFSNATLCMTCSVNDSSFYHRIANCFGFSQFNNPTTVMFQGSVQLLNVVGVEQQSSLVEVVHSHVRKLPFVREATFPAQTVGNLARIVYNATWKQKLISSNSKKVEFLNSSVSNIPPEGEYLPCIDTNQLTTVASVFVHRSIQGQTLSLVVAIQSEDGTPILQANKSKRRKNSHQTTEKLEASTISFDQDGFADIRIQAANVLKNGTKRNKCFAMIHLKRGAEVLEYFVSEPFYIIAKLNYKNYEKNSKAVTPSKSAATPVQRRNRPIIPSINQPATQEEQQQQLDSPILFPSPDPIAEDSLFYSSNQNNNSTFLPSFMKPQPQLPEQHNNSDFLNLSNMFLLNPNYKDVLQAQSAWLGSSIQPYMFCNQQQLPQGNGVYNEFFATYEAKQAAAQSIPAQSLVFDSSNSKPDEDFFFAQPIDLHSENLSDACCSSPQTLPSCGPSTTQQQQLQSNMSIDQLFDFLSPNPAPPLLSFNTGLNPNDFIPDCGESQ